MTHSPEDSGSLLTTGHHGESAGVSWTFCDPSSQPPSSQTPLPVSLSSSLIELIGTLSASSLHLEILETQPLSLPFPPSRRMWELLSGARLSPKTLCVHLNPLPVRLESSVIDCQSATWTSFQTKRLLPTSPSMMSTPSHGHRSKLLWYGMFDTFPAKFFSWGSFRHSALERELMGSTG